MVQVETLNFKKPLDLEGYHFEYFVGDEIRLQNSFVFHVLQLQQTYKAALHLLLRCLFQQLKRVLLVLVADLHHNDGDGMVISSQDLV